MRVSLRHVRRWRRVAKTRRRAQTSTEHRDERASRGLIGRHTTTTVQWHTQRQQGRLTTNEVLKRPLKIATEISRRSTLVGKHIVTPLFFTNFSMRGNTRHYATKTCSLSLQIKGSNMINDHQRLASERTVNGLLPMTRHLHLIKNNGGRVVPNKGVHVFRRVTVIRRYVLVKLLLGGHTMVRRKCALSYHLSVLVGHLQARLSRFCAFPFFTRHLRDGSEKGRGNYVATRFVGHSHLLCDMPLMDYHAILSGGGYYVL